MKAPPPSPEDCGSTRLSTNCTATAASAALPPARSMSRPASTATLLAADIMKDLAVPIWTGRFPVALSGAAVRSWAGAAGEVKACAAKTATKQARRVGLGAANMAWGTLQNCDRGFVRHFNAQENPGAPLGCPWENAPRSAGGDVAQSAQHPT